jgi:hypothetical protein
MKLNIIQRWAYKLGAPRSLLNVFAQEYYGYAIPDTEGRYPEWWYEEQGVPTSFRDCEVPEEVLKREQKRKNRVSRSPKVWVRVNHGKVVEVVANEALSSEPPNDSRYHMNREGEYPQDGPPQTVFTRERYEVRRRGDDDEIVTRVTQMRRGDGPPILNRSSSVPVFSSSSRDDDIMSFIREQAVPVRNRPAMAPGMENPGPLFHDGTSPATGPPFTHPHRSATLPNVRSNAYTNHTNGPPPRPMAGPTLPANPRPVRHERMPTQATNDSIFGYYSSPLADGQVSPRRSYRPQQGRQYTPMDGVDEESMSMWSGYLEENDEGSWVDEEVIERQEFRRAAAERLREYRSE